MTCVKSIFGKKLSTSFLPNSRFMNELETISPTKPQRWLWSWYRHKAQNRSQNGATKAYFLKQLS